MKELGHPPVLINTSFNLMGKPILNSWKEAFELRDGGGIHSITDGINRILS
jgi:predicted NodU family carbamoyl transferase